MADPGSGPAGQTGMPRVPIPELKSLIDEMSRELTEVTARNAELQETFRTASATAMSDKRNLSVTVGARGELTDLKFHSKDFQRMTPAALAKLILDTTRKAREQVDERMREQVTPHLFEGLDYDGLMNGTFDFTSFLPQVPESANLPYTSRVKPASTGQEED
ncbi:YbaB/EbfC family nucleoid-associated protein [Streptomyces sp. NPDC000410]|uniref:YbaB/EbfC family nucleoid-associated protein n=1 Tax=Streptomyces sp. NPDC000410 TaxID=3154254 RepID=UPI003327C164